MLERIYVDNFRCLTNFELKLAQTQLIVGRNGSGKTSLWDVLAKIQDLLTTGASVDDAFPEPSGTRWDTRNVQTFELEARLEDVPYHYKLAIRHERTSRGALRSIIATEELAVHGEPLYRRLPDGTVGLFGDERPSREPRTIIPFDESRSFFPVLQARPDNRRLRVFRDYVERLQMLSVAPAAFEPVSPGEAPRLNRDASNFASWIRSQIADKPQIASALGEDLKRCIAGYQALRFEKVGADARELVLDVKSADSNALSALALRELSDGERVLLVVYGVLQCIAPGSLLFLDEPDNFLALEEVEPLLAKLRQTVEERSAQLVVASHNATAIDYLAAGAAVELSRSRGGPVRAASLDFDRETGMRASEWVASRNQVTT